MICLAVGLLLLSQYQISEAQDIFIARDGSLCQGYYRTNIGFEANEFQDWSSPCQAYASEDCAKLFMCNFDTVATHNTYVNAKIGFQYDTNMTKANFLKMLAFSEQSLKILEAMMLEAENFRGIRFSDKTLNRMMEALLITIQPHSLEKKKELNKITSEAERLYGEAQACPAYMHTCLPAGEQEVENVMLKETDYDKLASVWKAWRDATGPTIEPTFSKMIAALNEGARENGYKDAGYAEWFEDMQDPFFDSYVWQLYEEIKPLYEQLHAYVRHKMMLEYPNRFQATDPIPAHILGNPWAQQWKDTLHVLMPYPQVAFENVDDALKKYSVHAMVKLADDFFVSLGMDPMTEDFWKHSVLEKPKDVTMVCHASASDMANGQDFRIKMCTNPTQQNFKTIHHEMGHIQYYMNYAHWLIPFRGGANSGFHEAIGDTIALSVNTPEHLKTLHLIKKVPKDPKFDINYLMSVALEKVAFIPFGLLTDVWRWRVFNGTYTKDTYNQGWWDLRMKYQGIMPPVQRNSGDYDALAKYHVATNVPYIRYFLSFIMQFQFYEAMCDASGHSGPLHRCDFYQSKQAGAKLKEMLQLGSSKPWQDAMEVLTGQRKINTKSILNYFQPLHDWLTEENQRSGAPVGWKLRKDLVA